MPTKISEVLSKFIQTANNATKIKGLLGTGENVSDPFSVPGKPDYMWVRIFRSSSQTLESALNSGVPRVHNLPIILELTESGYYKIIGPDYSDVQAVGDGTPGLTVAPHTHDLSHGNADMVESMRIMQGHFEVVENLTIAINDINNFYWNSTPSYFYRGTYDLTDNRPSTAGKWRWVKVGINASTKLIEVANGTDKDQTTVLSIADLNAISFGSSDVMPCFGVKLKQGQTAIQRVSDVADIRPWLSGINSSVVSAINSDGFITKTPSSNLSNEFALSTLATGLLKNTTTTGIPTIAVEGTDYLGTGATSIEYIQDLIGAFLVAGSGVTLTYDDGANTLTIATSISNETIDDRVAALLVAGNNIDITYDDTLNTLTIDVEALVSTDITDFNEAVDDRIASTIVAGNNIDVTYNDLANTLTIDVESLTSSDLSDFSEAVDDRVNALLVAGANISLTYDDGANTLTIAATGTHTQNTDTGTTQSSFQIDSGNSGPRIKNNSGTIEGRNAADSAYANAHFNGLDLETALPIAEGGTGQTSKTPAFDALAPGTTKGDIIVYDGTDNVRKAVGNNGRILKSDSAQSDGLSWVDDIGRACTNLALNSQFQRNARVSNTPTTLTSYADGSYCGDQWYVLSQTASIQYARTTGDVRSIYAGRIKQNQAAAQRMGIAQPIEGIVADGLAGKSARFQARIKCSSSQAIHIAILEWTGTVDNITKDVVNDWTSGTYTAGNFFLGSNLTVAGESSVTPSAATWTDISVTASISTSVKNIIVFIWTEGTAAQDVTLDITEVWLGEGTDTQVWMPTDPALDEYRCERFLVVLSSADTVTVRLAIGIGTATTTAVFNLPRLHFRTPGASLVATAADWSVIDGATTTPVTALSMSANSNERDITIVATTGGGLTQHRPYQILGDGFADRYMIFTAEL